MMQMREIILSRLKVGLLRQSMLEMTCQLYWGGSTSSGLGVSGQEHVAGLGDSVVLLWRSKGKDMFRAKHAVAVCTPYMQCVKAKEGICNLWCCGIRALSEFRKG